jgi:uncharacterized protein YlxP (DUF503 family)
MTFAFAVAHLHLPGARSLKQKRRVVKGLMDKIHHRFRVSIAETDFHDLHQRAEIGLALVHRNDHELERMLDEIHRLIDTVPEASLTDWRPELFQEVS